MTPTNDVSLEIQRRIQTANICFFGLRKHLQSSLFSHQTKYTIHKTLICPVLLYCSETVSGPKIDNGVYRRRFNHKLDKEFNSPNALNVTKTRRLHYAGHMIRRPENLPQKALFRTKPNERRN
jgi:hypothetical protein